MREKVFEKVMANLKNPRLYVVILILLLVVLFFFPYFTNFVGRKSCSQLDGIIIASGNYRKRYSFCNLTGL